MPHFVALALASLLLFPLAGCGNPSPEEVVESAETLLANGDAGSAMIELKSALQADPDAGQVRALLGNVHLALGDYPSALKEFERALDLGVDTEAVQIGILRAKNKVGRGAEVIGALEDKENLSPPFAVLLGQAFLAAGDRDRASTYLSVGRGLASGAMGLALIESSLGNAEQAQALAEEAVALPDADAEIFLAKGDIEIQFGMFDDALASYRQAGSMPNGQVMSRLGVARALLGKKDLDGAAAEVGEALKLAPGAVPAHLLNAAVQLELGNLDAAEASVVEIQRVLPDFTPAMYLMGMIKQQQGKTVQAEEQLRRLIAREPTNEMALKALGGILGEAGQNKAVVELLSEAAESSQDPDMLAMLGSAQLRLGRASDSAATLQRAVMANPESVSSRGQLALSLAVSGDAKAADALLSEAGDAGSASKENRSLLAMLRIREKDAVGAEAVIAELLAEEPESALPHHLHGMLNLLKEDTPGAEADFRVALDKDPAFFAAAQALAQLALQRNELGTAQAVMAEFLADNPKDLGALMGNAELASRAGDLDKSVAFLLDAAKENPDAVPPRLVLARIYVARNQIGEALAMIGEGLAIEPDNTDLLVMQADLSIATGDRAKAQQAADLLNDQLEQAADNPNFLAALGAIQLRLGDVDRASVNLERSYDLSGGKNPLALLNSGRLSLLKADAKTARDRLDALNALGLTSPEISLLEADILRLEGNTSKAAETYTKLIAQGVREAVFRLAALRLQANDSEQAVAAVEAWLVNRPDDVGGKLYLAQLLMELDPKKSIGVYEALAESGENALALNNLAYLYGENGDARAVATARAALEAAPDQPQVLDTLGWILVRQDNPKDIEEGVVHLRRSVQLAPTDATTLYHLGVGLGKSGAKAEAGRTLERALSLGEFPDRAAAQAELEALRE